MQRMSARDAKNGFGRLIDLARAGPVAIEKHGRAVVVVVALEEYERLIGNGGKKDDALTTGESKSPKGEQ